MARDKGFHTMQTKKMKKKIFSPKVLTRGFWGSLITNMTSENGNSKIQDGGANMADIMSIKQLNKTQLGQNYYRD